MSKLTFRADDDLVARLESLDASKSAVIRDALRRYLDADGDQSSNGSTGPGLGNAFDGTRKDRAKEILDRGRTDTVVNITLAVSSANEASTTGVRKPERPSDRPTPCPACGEASARDQPFCPHCGTDRGGSCAGCGYRLQDEWVFCPDCGRRTPPPDVIDGS